MTGLDAAFSSWTDTAAYHSATADRFLALVPPELHRHRDWVEENGFGFGCRQFHGLWYLLAKSLPDHSRFLELGVYRGQSLSAVDLASHLLGKFCTVVGVGPLNGCGGYYEERDYEPDVHEIFDHFNDGRPHLIRRLSTDPEAVAEAAALAPYDALYIDSQHDWVTASFEFTHYAPLVRSGGYLLCDDAGCNLDLKWTFAGFQEASDYFDSVLPPKTANANWTHVGNCLHVRIWKRN